MTAWTERKFRHFLDLGKGEPRVVAAPQGKAGHEERRRPAQHPSYMPYRNKEGNSSESAAVEFSTMAASVPGFSALMVP